MSKYFFNGYYEELADKLFDSMNQNLCKRTRVFNFIRRKLAIPLNYPKLQVSAYRVELIKSNILDYIDSEQAIHLRALSEVIDNRLEEYSSSNIYSAQYAVFAAVMVIFQACISIISENEVNPANVVIIFPLLLLLILFAVFGIIVPSRNQKIRQRYLIIKIAINELSDDKT